MISVLSGVMSFCVPRRSITGLNSDQLTTSRRVNASPKTLSNLNLNLNLYHLTKPSTVDAK